ncbi:hypothetical protein WMY93_032558 [Mugilogobius chulae]|uniref:Uncharacterized protein n=1 Tax=Mugilogobius chulae TaxID=88201 RepID=A0AAW0MW27_9GOBI
MQNVHGKEIDLLRTTVKVPGKRPPRAVSTCAVAKSNGLNKELSGLHISTGSVSSSSSVVSQMGSGGHQRSFSVSSADQWTEATVIANSAINTESLLGESCSSPKMDPPSPPRQQEEAPT